MATLEQLLGDVSDAKLRAELEAEVAALKGRKRFGLVYERHLPETVVVGDRDGLKVGDYVRPREEANNGHDFRLVDLDGDQATILSVKDSKERQVSLADLLTVRRFGDPTDVGLTPLGATTGSEARPYHAVIDGENFHALQLLTFIYERQVDLIYIDPPYNTGAKDWTYNNRFVDSNDAYRHSKWLSMMEKRLNLAKRLLKSDGVLIVTIDEKEVHRLGLLIDQLFPQSKTQMLTVVTNQRGVARGQEFARVDEYAIVVFMESARVLQQRDDMLTPSATLSKQRIDIWNRLMRRGTDSLRQDSPNQFYPIFIDPDRKAIVSVGEPLPLEKAREDVRVPPGLVAVWPLRTDGSEGRWTLSHKTLEERVAMGVAKVGAYNRARGSWSISYLINKDLRRIESGELEVVGRDENRVLQLKLADDVHRLKLPRTVWHRDAHNAGTYGSELLSRFVPGRKFPFPKSLYLVEDVLRCFVENNPEALIIDFFAGSGTTLHATCRLNAEDGGCRRCVLVTNNEVDPDTRAKLKRAGHLRGGPEYECHGIFEAVTRPRCEAVITGRRADGSDVPGTYLDGTPFADGFAENVEFFRLYYLDGEHVELGACFDAVHPLLWLAAGGRGERPEANGPFLINVDCGYAVLFDEDAFRDFEEALASQDRITHVAFLTDSEEAYAEMRERVGAGRETLMLYRDFLRHYRRRVRL